jgi:hypothetical protein
MPNSLTCSWNPDFDYCSIPAEADRRQESSKAPDPLAGLVMTEPSQTIEESPAVETEPSGGSPIGLVLLLTSVLLDKSGQIRAPRYPDVGPTDVNPLTGKPFRDVREFGEYQGFSPGHIDYLVKYSAEHCHQQLRNAASDRSVCSNTGAICAVEACEPQDDPALPENARPEQKVTPSTATAVKEDDKKKRYTVAVHAQGKDCGGKTSSTIGAPAITKRFPITVAEGLDQSMATQALLKARQLKIRAKVIMQAHEYIETGPAKGGRFGKKSFVVPGVAGGIRYDVDCHGDGPSFIN